MRFVMGRCARCGKKLRKDDAFYVCPNCGALICEICFEKLKGSCPFCGSKLTEYMNKMEKSS